MPHRTSTEFVTVDLTDIDVTGLTADNIEMQVTTTAARPDPTAWVTPDLFGNGKAELNVGPAGTVDWPAGPYTHTFVRIVGIPTELPVIYGGLLWVRGRS
jgi:hypothetical protein